MYQSTWQNYACCDEEEEILANECERKRKKANISENVYVHFDTPLTLEHEILLLKSAGFNEVAVDCIDGSCFIVARK